MEEKLKSKIIAEYDSYLKTLNHVKFLNIDQYKFNEFLKNTPLSSITEYLNMYVLKDHEKLIDEFIFNIFGNGVNFNHAVDIRTFLTYPDFLVESYILNPYNINKCNHSLEQSLIIAPVYELNIPIKTISRNMYILRIKRAEIAPGIHAFSYFVDAIDPYMYKASLGELKIVFRETFNCEPNDNDLILLGSSAIKYILENHMKEKDNSNDTLINKDTFVTFNYFQTKSEIENKFNISYKDQYETVSSRNTPWIYRGNIHLDNRKILFDSPVSLAYQRKK